MKFLCAKSSLYEAVTNVSKAVAEKSTLPTLEGIRFNLENSLLELTGYDLEIGIRTTISVRSNDNGKFIINAKLFSEMINKMPADDILVEISENLQVTLSGGVTTFNLFATNADEYPELPQKDSELMIPVVEPLLKNMINQTKFAVAVTDIKPILKGELFEIEDGKFTLAAIDGYRLAVRYEPVKYDGNIKFVVPSKTLNQVVSLLGDNEDNVVNLYPSKKHIIFEIGGYMVYSRLLEGEFHPYKSAIPTTSSTEVVVDRKELMKTLERAMLLISERTPSPVRCYFETNTIRLNCSTSLGKITDEIHADITGPVIEIGFKCKFLHDAVRYIEDEKIKLQMSGSLHPMKIVSCNEDTFTNLVLPVRLPKE